MADLSINFAGIHAPNPFWLASGPPSNTGTLGIWSLGDGDKQKLASDEY